MKGSKLFSLGFLIGLFLLLLNDLYLKETYHNWTTGKLSDFAGLFVFPIFLSSINNKRPLLNYYFTFLFFVFWKSNLSTNSIAFVNDTIGTNFSRVIDYTDLVALFILPFSYWYYMNSNELKITAFKPIVFGLSVFSFFATSAPDMTSEAESRLTGRYHRLWEYDEYDKTALYIGYQSKDCKSCYRIVLGPDVISYGYNEDFIIAKTNPVVNNKTIDTTKSEYSILIVSKDSADILGDREVYKGLNKKEFESKRKELGIPGTLILKDR